MSTILIGVDATERSEDAIAFGRRLADAAGATSSSPAPTPIPTSRSRASNAAYREALREDALKTARAMRDAARGHPRDARADPDHGQPLAGARAARPRRTPSAPRCVIVGSTHTGRAGRVLPGSTGERLLHGAPCSVAVVPKDYRDARRRADPPRSASPTTTPTRRKAAVQRGRRAGARPRRRARGHRRRLDRVPTARRR